MQILRGLILQLKEGRSVLRGGAVAMPLRQHAATKGFGGRVDAPKLNKCSTYFLIICSFGILWLYKILLKVGRM